MVATTVAVASEAPAARLYGATYKSEFDATTTEAPAARRAHARCGPRSFTPLTRCGPAIACARLAATPSSPAPPSTATAPHASPASSASLRFAPVGRLPRACDSRPSVARRHAPPLRLFIYKCTIPPLTLRPPSTQPRTPRREPPPARGQRVPARSSRPRRRGRRRRPAGPAGSARGGPFGCSRAPRRSAS